MEAITRKESKNMVRIESSFDESKRSVLLRAIC